MKHSNGTVTLHLTKEESSLLQELLEDALEHEQEYLERQIDDEEEEQWTEETRKACCAVENILQYLGVEGYEFS